MAVSARVVFLVAEVVGQLGVQGDLYQALLQLLEQAAVLEQLFGSGILGQFIDKLVELVQFLLLGHGFLCHHRC